jgi:CheY-like chemotaxis protein
MYGDFTRLAQAIANLLTNAVKYTDRGGQLSITTEAAGGDLIVQVRDTGIGIHPELMPRIFDLFMQAERSANRARSGLGIGLTLARRLIELHGGAIEAHSPGPGGGTTFTVRLPRSAAPAPPLRAEQGNLPAVGCRVLIAEDIPDAAEMLCLFLEQLGHDVRVAADGVQAVAMAKEFAPVVALLDVGMPRMDGYEAAREIRAALGSRVMLVALTGWGQDEDQQRARAAGFDQHLTKPADPELLERLIAEAAGRV